MNAEGDGLEVRLDHAVHPGLDLSINFHLRAEIGILFGPSGAGKSTILRLIAGLLAPDSGRVVVGGTTWFDSSRKINLRLRERGVGLIFQDDLLFPHLDVARNVNFGLDRWPRREAEARLAEVAEICGITRLLDRDPGSLSGGERQRVGLARALAPRPRLLLCDEPVSALDQGARQAMIDRIKSIQRAETIPVLYVTHATDEAIALGDRLFLLSAGQIVAEGTPLEALSSRVSTEPIRLSNVFEAVIETNAENELATILRVIGGPSLVVPKREGAPGDRLKVAVEADEIVLAVGPIGLVSARNLIAGTVERVVNHGLDAEVLIRTGTIWWGVGVVRSTVESLGLIAGVEVRMIIKSRSCRVVPLEPT